jgi:ComF family protein
MITSTLLDNILVRCCELCGTCGTCTRVSASICQNCLDDLPTITSCCSICSKQLPTPGICGSCLQTHPPVEKTISALKYLYPADYLIKNIKYNQRFSALLVLTAMLSNKIALTSSNLPEVMLPIPLHYSRFYKRGFNQSTVMCKTLSRLLKIKYDDRLIQRSRYTLPMHTLNPAQRKSNVRGAFKVRHRFSYKSIAIVDDVITSGATGYELARLLKAQGAEHVELWSLARA